MDLNFYYEKIHSVRTNEVPSNMGLRLVIGVLVKKLGGENLDFSCPICINDALRKIRKLSKADFIELLTKQSMKSKSENPFILKGSGSSARTFFFKNQNWSNENLTLGVARSWIKYRESVLTNFEFSEAAAKEVQRLGVSKDGVSAWMISNGKTYEEYKAVIQPTAQSPIPEVEKSAEKQEEKEDKKSRSGREENATPKATVKNK